MLWFIPLQCNYVPIGCVSPLLMFSHECVQGCITVRGCMRGTGATTGLPSRPSIWHAKMATGKALPYSKPDSAITSCAESGCIVPSRQLHGAFSLVCKDIHRYSSMYSDAGSAVVSSVQPKHHSQTSSQHQQILLTLDMPALWSPFGNMPTEAARHLQKLSVAYRSIILMLKSEPPCMLICC